MGLISIGKGIWKSWWERDDHLVRDDFENDRDYDIERDWLLVATPLGFVPIPGDMRYDRFTGVYDTDYPVFWKASAFHDLACGDNYVIRNELGVILSTDRWVSEAIFLYLMTAAARHIIVEAISHNLPHYVKDSRAMIRRSLRYHMGVSLLGPRKKR